MTGPRLRRGARLIAAATALVLVAGSATASAQDGGWRTSRAPMLTAVLPGATVEALITVGDTLTGGYRFEAIPDGISLATRGRGRVDVYVNHETSTVPFPYNPTSPTEANSQNDFNNSELSHLIFNRRSGNILSGRMAISSKSNFQRFCSNYLATRAEGFDRPLMFTNEEGVDWVNRSGTAFPAVVGADNARQIGVVVAMDIKNGKHRPIWGMGRLNHENTVAIPGFSKVVLLTGDDTFTNDPSQSQLYSYIARDGDSVWKDEGSLWAFKPDAASGKTKYEDFAPGSTESIGGTFIQVPKLIATGRNADGSELMAGDVPAALGGPYPLPPNTTPAQWQKDPAGVPIDGPQWVLEHWSQTNGVFDFIRIEDMAYDKRPGKGNVVYVVDSGRGTTGVSAARKSTNGRVWEMILDPNDPTRVTSLRILIEGDDSPVKSVAEIHQPDNIESTRSALYLTEDPGSSQQFASASEAGATTARLWRYDLTTGLATVAFKVDQSSDEGPTDVDGVAGVVAPGRLGAWESSGIVDASAAFGPGAFLVTVQAHSLWVEKAPGADNNRDNVPDFTNKREGGQLLLVRVPGG